MRHPSERRYENLKDCKRLMTKYGPILGYIIWCFFGKHSPRGYRDFPKDKPTLLDLQEEYEYLTYKMNRR